jgi:hypothetical protein
MTQLRTEKSIKLDLAEELPMAPLGPRRECLYPVVLYTSILAWLQFSLHLGVSHQFSSVTMSDQSDLHRTAWIRFYLASASYSDFKVAKLALKFFRKKEFIDVELHALSRELKASLLESGSSDAFQGNSFLFCLFWKSWSRISCTGMRIRTTAART